MINFKGYVSSRKMNDQNFIDQSVQNLVIKKNCENRKFNYLLSSVEYKMNNCYLMLNELLIDLKKNKFDGIAFFSLEQLPKDFFLQKNVIHVVNLKKKLFFSTENLLIENKKDLIEGKNLIKIQSVLKFCPKSLDLN